MGGRGVQHTVHCRSTNQFDALWVDGDVTLNGLTTTNTTALHVGGDFIISGPTSINTFGPVFVIGYVDWGGTASVKTTDYTNATAAAPAPMWIGGTNPATTLGFNRTGGPYNDEYGDTFVVFRVTWASTGGTSTVNCPLFATTEMITTSNAINFGTMVTDAAHPNPRPMTLYMVCDNDGYYTQTCNWGSTGQFYGLMILFEAGITISNGNATAPAVVGSVLTIGGDNGLQAAEQRPDRLLPGRRRLGVLPAPSRPPRSPRRSPGRGRSCRPADSSRRGSASPGAGKQHGKSGGRRKGRPPFSNRASTQQPDPIGTRRRYGGRLMRARTPGKHLRTRSSRTDAASKGSPSPPPGFRSLIRRRPGPAIGGSAAGSTASLGTAKDAHQNEDEHHIGDDEHCDGHQQSTLQVGLLARQGLTVPDLPLLLVARPCLASQSRSRRRHSTP